ncbi:MAG: VOC family protein [Rhodobacteraceae bacterium]|nr:VOC family protein [Paracoccaceae bacterium]
MEQRISLTTLGVRDIAASASFYEALGWRRAETPEGIVAFDLIGQTLALYPLDRLAEDIGLAPSTLGTGAVTLAYNCRERDEVAEVLNAASAAGGEILRPASDVFWGGHVGYFRTPDGHIWEVTHNPLAPLSPEGAFRWNGYG